MQTLEVISWLHAAIEMHCGGWLWFLYCRIERDVREQFSVGDRDSLRFVRFCTFS